MRTHRPSARLVAAAAAVLVTAALPQLSSEAATSPTVGGTCSKSQLGKTTSTLVCRKSGTSYKWAKRTTTSSGTRNATTGSGVAETLPVSTIDLVAIPIGAAPPTLAITLDVTCHGLSGTPTEKNQSATFGAQGGTNQVAFALVAPGASNPTGSTCEAKATVSGATPTIRLLVAGRPTAGPASGATLVTTTFSASTPLAITALIDLTNGAAIATPLTTTSAAPTATSTTTLAATTTTTRLSGTTTPPPASGKPEVTVKFLGTVPTGVSGTQVTLTCTSTVAGAPFQVQTASLSTAGGTATLPVTLAPALGSFAGTICQLEARVGGDSSANTAVLRVLLNGQPLAGPTTGNLINSPSFPAPSAFGMTFEVAFGGATASSTTTTLPGATTTTTTTPAPTTVAPTPSVVTLTRTGANPVGITEYQVSVNCTNVTVNGGAFAASSQLLFFGVAGGSQSLSFVPTATSTCLFKVDTAGSSNTNTGTISLTAAGVLRGTGANGTLSAPAFTVTGPFATAITVAY